MAWSQQHCDCLRGNSSSPARTHASDVLPRKLDSVAGPSAGPASLPHCFTRPSCQQQQRSASQSTAVCHSATDQSCWAPPGTHRSLCVTVNPAPTTAECKLHRRPKRQRLDGSCPMGVNPAGNGRAADTGTAPIAAGIVRGVRRVSLLCMLLQRIP